MDLISRQAAIDVLMELTPYKNKRELINRCNASIADAEGRLGGIAECVDEIEDLPPTQPERKTGKWTINDCHAAVYKYHCSMCGANHRARYDFCPSCGSYNGGEQDDT